MDLFDYGNINDEHKKAILEVIDLANQLGNVTFAELLKHKFQIVEPKKYDLNDSEFITACNSNKINYNIQGYITEGPAHAPVHYPLVSITEDIRKLNDFIKNV
jgi:hypothetical protein